MATIPVRYINPFFAAVKTICVETLNISVTSGPLRLQRPDERMWKLYPISAAIHLRSALEGVISLCFSEPMAIALASSLMNQKLTAIDEDTRDALGEVANLIIGTAKRTLPGGLIDISAPTVLPTHKIDSHGTGSSLLLPFESASGRFVMKMSILRISPEATSAVAAANPPHPAVLAA